MRTLIVLAAALPLLAGCGSDQFSRVSTGAGTWAGTGATIGLLGYLTSAAVELAGRRLTRWLPREGRS